MTSEMTLEQYAYGQLAPHLLEGEQFVEYGVFLSAKKINSKRKKRYDKPFIVGITPLRIMLIETRHKFSLSGAVKLENRGLVFHNIADIKAAYHHRIRYVGIAGYKPLRLVFNDGSVVEYHAPISPNVCASQPVLSSYPARLEYFLSTPPPRPQGQIPAVPAQAAQASAEAATAEYKQNRLVAWALAGGGLLLLIMAISTTIFLFAMLGVPSMAAGFVHMLENSVQRRASLKA